MGHSPRMDTSHVQEPIPVATSSPGKPTKPSSRLQGNTTDSNADSYRGELNISLDSPVIEEVLMKEINVPRESDSMLDQKINRVFGSQDNSSSHVPVKDQEVKEGDTSLTSSSPVTKTSGSFSRQIDQQPSVPKVVLEGKKDSEKSQQLSEDDKTLVTGISPLHSPGALKKCASETNMAAGELEVPVTNLNGSASSSIEDWTQTDDLGGAWSRSVGYADSGTDPDNNDLLDELERLRRERQRILDMLAKDMMPSKLQARNLFIACNDHSHVLNFQT